MLLIKNKDDSARAIKRLGINRIMEGTFYGYQYEGILAFMERYPFPLYNLRDRARSCGEVKYGITRDEVIKSASYYEKLTIFESLKEADNHLILQGDVFISEDFEVMASLSSEKCKTLRRAMENPEYHLHIDLKEEKEPNIPGLTEILDYIINNELFGVYVEISSFEIGVGVNDENIIVWEIRNY